MKRPLLVLFRVLLVAVVFSAPLSADDCSSPELLDPYACLELLVEYDPASFDVAAFNATYGTVVEVDIPALEVMQVRAPDEATREAIERDGFAGVTDTRKNVQLLSPECRQRSIGVVEFGHDPPDLLSQPGVEAIWGLALPAAGSGVLVAVADSGLDASHPAFAGLVVSGGLDLIDGDGDPSEEANGIDDDGDGVTDAGYGHGTVVASLVGTLAPGASILPIRIVDDECRTSAMRVAAAIIAGAEAGARVVNLSIGMLDSHRYVEKALAFARDRDVLIVVSAGNSGERPGEYPSRDSHVLSVAATDTDGIKAPFSSYGSAVDLVAPGVDLLGAYPEDRYLRMDGTSFSAALVSGAAASAFAANPCSTARDIVRLLERTARPVDDLPGNEPWSGDLGEGLVDGDAVALPGSAIETLEGLMVFKVDAERLGFVWLVDAEPTSELAVHVNSVSDAAELPLASSNDALCPACPAPSLTLRCEAPLWGGSCVEAVPGALIDPSPVLYFQALGACRGVEGAL